MKIERKPKETIGVATPKTQTPLLLHTLMSRGELYDQNAPQILTY